MKNNNKKSLKTAKKLREEFGLSEKEKRRWTLSNNAEPSGNGDKSHSTKLTSQQSYMLMFSVGTVLSKLV